MSTLVDGTYDIWTFSSMGYVLVSDKRYKKESIKSRANTPQATRIFTEFVELLIKEAEQNKLRINGIECHMQVL